MSSLNAFVSAKCFRFVPGINHGEDTHASHLLAAHSHTVVPPVFDSSLRVRVCAGVCACISERIDHPSAGTFSLCSCYCLPAVSCALRFQCSCVLRLPALTLLPHHPNRTPNVSATVVHRHSRPARASQPIKPVVQNVPPGSYPVRA